MTGILKKIISAWDSFWASFWGDDRRGGLSEEEYEEYEFLGACMEWRRLTHSEAVRYNHLYEKRGMR